LLLLQRQNVLRGFLELFFLVLTDVGPLALGEPLYEECPGTAPEENDGPVASRFSLPWPGDTLFDDPAAQVCVDLPLFGPGNSLTQDLIRNPFLSGKAMKPPGLVNSHGAPFIL
jgi:hypothetical protein